MAEPVVDNSSFDQALLGSSIDVDFELTFDDLYLPCENESFFLPVDATNLESSVDCSATAAEEEAATCKTSITKRKREIGEEDTSMNNKYRRSNEDSGVTSGGDEEKRNARLIKNRESALLSRQRKKHYVEELEDKVKNLQSVIADLNSKVSYFMSENVTLRHKVGPGKGTCWSSVTYPWMPFPAYLGSHQVVPNLLPIPRLKPQPSLATKVNKSEAKTKKVASVSVLGLLFCLFLFGALAPPSGFFYGEYDQVRGRVFDLLVNNSSSIAQYARVSDQEVVTNVSVPPRNGSELLVASVFVPRNEKLVKLDGNLIIHSEMENEVKSNSLALRSSDNTRTKDMSKHINTQKRKALSSSGSEDSKDKLNSTTSNGEMQQWFREGVAGPMFSSGMCTEVFQFDASSTSGAIIPTTQATQQPKNKGKNNRRILRSGLPLSDPNLTRDQDSSNKENFNETKPFPSMVVSVLVDPREEGSDGDIDGVTKGIKSLSTVFIVVLVDGVNYVTYSCVLPPPEVSHLVTT